MARFVSIENKGHHFSVHLSSNTLAHHLCSHGSCSFDGTHALSTRDDPIPSMIFRFPARSRSGPCHFFRFPVRSFSGFLPGRVPFFLLCVRSVLLFPFAPLVDYLCVIQLRKISPCVLPRPVSPYSCVWL